MGKAMGVKLVLFEGNELIPEGRCLNFERYLPARGKDPRNFR
jgi:hypothetical protein